MDTVTAIDTMAIMDIIMGRGLLSLAMDIMDTENRYIAKFLKSSDVNKKY